MAEWLEMELVRAAQWLDLKSMRKVVAAGARSVRTLDDRAWLAELVVDAEKDEQMNEFVRAERQLAALQLLEQLGGLGRDAATSALTAAAASAACDATVVAFLLDVGGADARSAGGGGFTALHLVERADVARLLINAGADVHATNVDGGRPLAYCCQCTTSSEAAHVAAVLLAAGADVNAVDASGRTALATAFGEGYPGAIAQLVPMLLTDAGADPTIVAHDGGTALDAAIERLTAAAGAVELAGTAVAAATAWCLRMQHLVATVARAEAWWRRRHMLLAVRGRGCDGDSAAAAAAAAATAGGSGAACHR